MKQRGEGNKGRQLQQNKAVTLYKRSKKDAIKRFLFGSKDKDAAIIFGQKKQEWENRFLISILQRWSLQIS